MCPLCFGSAFVVSGLSFVTFSPRPWTNNYVCAGYGSYIPVVPVANDCFKSLIFIT